jgi:alkylhydroperoxidase/carboxymuconolactone decarboxylase family protein YurZ
MRGLPPTLQNFKDRKPEIWEAHERLSQACQDAGPLDRKTALLIKIGIAAAASKRTPLATHIRSALEEGVSREEVEHAIILTATNQGLSTMMQAMKELDSVLSS